jgi:hypothetical protein
MKIEKAAKLLSGYQHVKHGGTVRCTICNCVSSEDIETTIGDYRRGMSFAPDPITSGFICMECQDVIQDQRFDYELMDNLEDD